MANAHGREASILIVNDQEWAARSLESILAAEGYGVLRAYTGRQALERAATSRPDAVILDAQMPDIAGVEVCRILRSDASFGHTTPMFITTAGPAGRQERLNAYRAGAWEFFGQPLDGETILLKLRLYLDSKSVVDTLRNDSLVDETTGLYNRRGMLRRGRELAAEAVRGRRPLACAVFSPEAPDLHPAVARAEELAQRIGDFFRASGRTADAIGRLGPLEFGVIALGTSEAEARLMVRRFNEVAATSVLRDVLGVPQFAFRSAVCAVDEVGESDDRQLDLEEMLTRAVSVMREVSGAGVTHAQAPSS